ncbi:hypothetical protein [Halarcobacter anaerophilus]|uniref:Uncharacterized protein n=1 Tax=Halarcobacter anaerophilus TaxID=877500 RepID=A0A4Q0XVJ4_9BACT|nr:hypothetical protein [Halarcobacter anaerophilus]QDF30386.1 hypothetical protein AANAER_2955 [Halarcobacter anaerophilus]RXJ61526.1 hypothetical protein CRV06_13115 [Halarcobacter anaerophilus]
MSIKIRRKNENKTPKLGDLKMLKDSILKKTEGIKQTKSIDLISWSASSWQLDLYMRMFRNRMPMPNPVEILDVCANQACLQIFYKKSQDFEHKKKKEFFSHFLGL